MGEDAAREDAWQEYIAPSPSLMARNRPAFDRAWDAATRAAAEREARVDAAKSAAAATGVSTTEVTYAIRQTEIAYAVEQARAEGAAEERARCFGTCLAWRLHRGPRFSEGVMAERRLSDEQLDVCWSFVGLYTPGVPDDSPPDGKWPDGASQEQVDNAAYRRMALTYYDQLVTELQGARAAIRSVLDAFGPFEHVVMGPNRLIPDEPPYEYWAPRSASVPAEVMARLRALLPEEPHG